MPLAVFGVVVLAFEIILGRQGADQTFAQILFFALAILLAFAIVAAFALATELLAPLRSVVAAVDRVSKGDLSSPIQVVGDDELARLADSHNRLAADLERRNRELGRILAAIDEVSPQDDVEALVERTAADATSAFALIDATVVMGDPSIVEEEEVVPGVSRPLRAVMRAGGEDIGVLIGRLPATRRWEPADQDLLELFASEMAAAIRNGSAVRARGVAEPPAARARCRQGRLPPRRQPQPPDAADQHPRLRRAARTTRRPTGASGSSPSNRSGCRGWSASY